MNNNSLLYYTLFLYFFFKVCNAQVNRYTFQNELNLYTTPYIVLNLDSIPLSDIKPLLKKEQVFAVNFSKSNTINTSFLKLYKEFNDSLVVISDDKVEGVFVENLHLIYYKESNLKTFNLVKKRERLDSTSYYKADKLISIKIGNNDKLTDSLFFEIWKRFGRLPNFIELNRVSLQKTDSIIGRLNALRKVYGTVETEKGELINGVRFKDYDQSIINGNFSFPILKGEKLPVLIPYKAGYHFSPDIIYTTPENLNNIKKFTAFPLEIEYGLSDYFVFNPKFKNKIKESEKELLINNVEIKTDETHGKVGYFNNRSYIDAGVESKNSLQKSFTIAAWVKPTSLRGNNSILGKGDNFVVKLHNGFLTFTMADVKDYISEVSVIPLNEWTHIAIAHSQLDNKLFFYINGALTEELKLVSEYETSDYNILIGSNLWEEFFEGYLASIKIWERELNENEILSLLKKRDVSWKDRLGFGLVTFALLFVIMIFIYRKYKSKKNKAIKINRKARDLREQKSISNNQGVEEDEKVMCFGKLRIINKEGVDVAEKLSPLLKKIFVIIFLYSNQGSKKGISTKQLTEFLWPGMSPQKAKNTRGTNINNLRSILNSCQGINLVFKDKSWFIELDEDSFCDYLMVQQCLHAFSSNDYSVKELEHELPQFLQILKGGRLFSSSSEPWLDPFIEKFSNQIIEQCLEFTEVLKIEKHSDLLLHLASVICVYDDLNEKAHQLKLQALIKQGKLSLAYKAHDNFIKLYYKIYKENYSVSFESITSEQNLEKK